MVEYLIEKASTEFIIKFAQKTESFREHIVAALYTSGSEEARKEILERVSFDDLDLSLAAENPEIPCRPTYFSDLIKRITNSSGTKSIIFHGIQELFKANRPEKELVIIHGIRGLFKAKRTECIDPLLDSLKDKEDSRVVAIQAIFTEAARNNDKTWTERFYDDPVITPTIYAKVLAELLGLGGKRIPIFVWLFNEADLDDLQALLINKKYKKLRSDIRRPVLQAIIKRTLLKLRPPGSRHRTLEKAMRTKTVVDRVTTGTDIAGVGDLAAGYVAEE